MNGANALPRRLKIRAADRFQLDSTLKEWELAALSDQDDGQGTSVARPDRYARSPSLQLLGSPRPIPIEIPPPMLAALERVA